MPNPNPKQASGVTDGLAAYRALGTRQTRVRVLSF